MPTTFWFPNAQFTAQVDTITLLTVAAGGVLTATINGKSISYVVQAGDTTTTAAAAWFALLNNTAVTPPEFQEITWGNATPGVITATAATPGTPFTLTATATGAGTTVAQNHPTLNSSPSDAGNPSNWLRQGLPSLPQTADDVVVADSVVPILWNLNALAGIQLNSYTRWQTMTGQIGLPEVNQGGYQEYRPLNLKLLGLPLSSPSGSSSGIPTGTGLPIVLGLGQSGSGPPRENYDLQTGQCKVTVLAGQSVSLIGTNAANTLSVVGTSVACAGLAGQSAAFASITADGGGAVTLGPGCTVSGTVTLIGASLVTMTAPGGILAQAGSTVVMNTSAPVSSLVVPSVKATLGSTVTWLSDASITTLTLQVGSTFSKASDVRAITITNATLDGDSCQILDPNNAITFTNPVTVNNQVSSGPLQFLGPRTLKLV